MNEKRIAVVQGVLVLVLVGYMLLGLIGVLQVQPFTYLLIVIFAMDLTRRALKRLRA